MQNREKEREELKAYRLGHLTIIELMTVLAILGLLLHCICRYFFL